MTSPFPRYTGMRPFIKGPLMRLYYQMESGSSCLVYEKGSVDREFFNTKISLNADTAGYLYSKLTRTRTAYKKGSRPFLENIVKKTTAARSGQWEKALALFRFCRDIYKNYPNPWKGDAPFFGGTEEEIIRKGSNKLCNETARVFCVLCQIAGIPARYVGMWPGFGPAPEYKNLISHAVNEVFIKGKWRYMDAERGVHFPASAWELKQNPGLCDKISLKEIDPLCRHWDNSVFFTEKSEIAIANYYIEDFEKYSYPWKWNTEDLRDKTRRFRRNCMTKLMTLP